ncbi:MAG: hypothetical protein B6D41_13955 [Chloroflexi bacterium UTCFX4]|nr:MAG: hypothetical protein B6D41_13955 [Chloroflexi bacterium UTCFX4]
MFSNKDMDDTITLYSNQDLTTLVRSFDVGALSEPSDELTGRYQYIISRDVFREAYKHWNHNETPLLKLRDTLSDADIYLGKPSAERVREAIQNQQPGAQLF